LLFLVTSFSFIIIDFLVVAEKHVYDLVYNLASAIFVFFLSYFGVTQNDIYNHSSRKSNLMEKEDTSTEKTIEKGLQEERPQANSRKDELYDELIVLFEKEKLYLQHDLSLADIAERLNSNKHYISNIINEKLNKNFYQFVNELRIKEAIELLKNPDKYLYTIESISQKAGFKSKSSFNKFFKEITGMTPSEFRKEEIR
jgi:AraC-like DNA-binding protein